MPTERYMILLIITCILFAIAYTLLMALYIRGWALQQQSVLPHAYIPHTAISIVIAARNEEQHIAACIDSILAQRYPKALFEIIVADDHSTDRTAAIVKSYGAHVQYISMSLHKTDNTVVAYKKQAIAAAISSSKGELIVTTDADCIAAPDWLLNIAACYEATAPVMIIGPVDFFNDGSMVQQFQSIDFMTMQGITGAAHALQMGNMCNGANLAFSRVAYDAVNGYDGIDHMASGDDYLLLMKLHRAFPNRISYLKSRDVIIRTMPQPGWKSFLRQRIRWSSKSGKYNDKKLTAILLLVYLYNFLFLVLFAWAFFQPLVWLVFLPLLLWKIMAELFFIKLVSRFFSKRVPIVLYVLLQPLHIAYIIAAGFMGFIGVYQWKGRRVH